MNFATLIFPFMFLGAQATPASNPVWPPAPDPARVAFVEEIRCEDIKPHRGVFRSVVGVISGNDSSTELRFPFDVAAVDDRLFLTCQDVPALVELDPDARTFRLHKCDDLPMQSPVALCTDGKNVYVTDSAAGAVYRYNGDDVDLFVTKPLERPTGIAFVSSTERLHVVDTGTHSIQVFGTAGRHLGSFGERGDEDAKFNYPTFAAAHDSLLLINDTLNYRIKLFARQRMLAAIGREGDGPGAFARPKGIAVDARGRIYVVDGLFDNVQVFDRSGRLLLVIGGAGDQEGQFWSPAGITVSGDLIYIADTFNHRIQVLRALDG